jgi:hypothetical protein
MEEKIEIQPNLQIEKYINTNEGEFFFKENFFKLHFQRRKWRHDNKNALCWSFYCVNENKLLDVKCFQLMKCIFCYVGLVLITNAKTQGNI